MNLDCYGKLLRKFKKKKKTTYGETSKRHSSQFEIVPTRQGVRQGVKSLSRVQLFAIPWTVVYQTFLSRQGYWNGLPFPSLGDLPDPGIEPRSPALRVHALPSEPPPLDKSGEIWTSK